MKKIIAAGLMTGVALIGAATAHADSSSWSYEKGRLLSNMAAAMMKEEPRLGVGDACIGAVQGAMDLGVTYTKRSDFSPRDAVYGCLASLS